MEHAFEVYTEDGVEIRRYPITEDKNELVTTLQSELVSKTWYRLRYHLCRNQERAPCDPWELVAEHGNVPDDNEMN